MKNITINSNLFYLLFFLHPLIYSFDGDPYRNYWVLGVFIISLFALKSLNSINFREEKKFLILYYIFILFQQYFIDNRDFQFGITFFITFVIASVPFWLFENIKLNTRDLSKIIDQGINIIFFICIVNYFSSFIFNFGEVYKGGLFFNKRCFGILGDSFTPILTFLQIYFISKKQFIKSNLSLLFLLITGGKAGILMSFLIIISDAFIKRKSILRKNIFLFSLFFLITLIILILNNINFNEFILGIENSYNNRVLSFDIGINYFKDAPLIGIGINKGLERAFTDSEALADFYGIDNFASVWQVQNNFLRILSETGIFGITLVVLVHIFWLKKVIFCLNETKYDIREEDALVYSTSLWVLAYIISYQGIAWFLPGHPNFAWILMFTTLNNHFIRNK